MFEAWHAFARRYDQRNTSDKNSEYAALFSNICERYQDRDVEQFDDVLGAVINETDKFENRFGKIRDEEEMFAVKKLMLGGATLKHDELRIALENIIVDKVSPAPTVRQKKVDTCAPKETERPRRITRKFERRRRQRIMHGHRTASRAQTNRQRQLGGARHGPSWNTQRYTGGNGGKGAHRGGQSSWEEGNGKS